MDVIKKLQFKVMATIMICLLGWGFHSCLDEKVDSYSRLTIGTIKVIEANDYYFALDDGSTMYPGDTTNIHNYTPVTGQRAILYFDLLDEKVPEYDYNALVYRIEDILTKDIYFMPTEKEDSIGDDRINLNNAWLSGNYVNMQYQFYYNEESGKVHMLNLVVNEANDNMSNEEGYLVLELRHNAYHDEQRTPGKGLVSFKLDNIAREMEGKKGLIIRINTLYDGVQYKKVDFASNK